MSNFRALRKRRGLTQATLAKQIGASQTRVSAHELGKRPLTMDQLLAATSCLETSVDYLLDRTNTEAPYPSGNANMPGRNLRAIRKRRYLTQIGLQIRTGINQSAISQYENGLCLPTIQNLSILANYFRVSTDYLLDRTDVETPYPPKEKTT